MKKIFLTLTLIILAAVFAYTQERPRYYDNFDTPVGVRVHYPPSPPVETYAMTSMPASPGGGPSVNVDAAPVADKRSGKRSVRVVMTVTDGYAQRTAPVYQPVAQTVTGGYVQRTAQVSQPASQIAMAGGKFLLGYTTGDMLIDSYIVESSGRYSIDPLLIYAQMSQESSFKLRATSNKGASGLMQLMPATARRLGVANIYDPQQNIEGGVKYMRILLDMFNGDINLALAGYNAGEGAVIKYGYQIPPYNETQDYVRRISSRYQAISGTSAGARPQKAAAGRSYPKESAPMNMYQPRPSTVQMPDGRTRLINR